MLGMSLREELNAEGLPSSVYVLHLGPSTKTKQRNKPKTESTWECKRDSRILLISFHNMKMLMGTLSG